jgi:hypothetical protein
MKLDKRWNVSVQQGGSHVERTITLRQAFQPAQPEVVALHRLPQPVQEAALEYILESSNLNPQDQRDVVQSIARDPAVVTPITPDAGHADKIVNSIYDLHSNPKMRSLENVRRDRHPFNELITNALRIAQWSNQEENRAFTSELITVSDKNRNPFISSVPHSARADVRRFIQAAITAPDPIVSVEAAMDITAYPNPDLTPDLRTELIDLFRVEYESHGDGVNLHALNRMNFIATGKREGNPPADNEETGGTAGTTHDDVAQDINTAGAPRTQSRPDGNTADFLNDEGVVGARMRGEIVRTVNQFFTPLLGRLQQLTLNRLVAGSFVVGTNTKVGENVAKMIAHIQSANRAHVIRNKDIRVLGDNEVAVGEQLTAIATGIEDMLQRADAAFLEGVQPEISSEEEGLLSAELLRTPPRTADVMVANWWNPTRRAGVPAAGTAVTGIPGRNTPQGCVLPLAAFQPTALTRPGIMRAAVPTGQNGPSRAEEIATLVSRYLSRHGRDRAVTEMMSAGEGVPMPRATVERAVTPEVAPADDVARRIRELLNM